MSRILLDQNVPIGLRRFLRRYDVSTAYGLGWGALSNGDLLASADAAGFDLLISCDQNLAHQQNLAGLRLAVLLLDTNRWVVIRAHAAEIEKAVGDFRPGSFALLRLGP